MDNTAPTRLSFELPSPPTGVALPVAFCVCPSSFTARGKSYRFTEASAESVIKLAKDWGNQHSADWEHSTYTAAEKGGQAPASAWYDLEIRKGSSGPELWATNVQWTPTAAEQLSKREYRYFSPMFRNTPDGEITEFLNLALTNLPATDGMKPLTLAKGHAEFAPPTTQSPSPELEQPMKTVLTALSLKNDASEADALAAVTKLSQAQATLLSLTGKDTVEAALDSVKAGRAAVEEVTKLSKQVTDLETKVQAAAVEQLIAKGKAEGKITPALEAFAKELGAKDVTLLSKFIEKSAPAVSGESRREKNDEGRNEMTEDSVLAKELERVTAILKLDPKKVEANTKAHKR